MRKQILEPMSRSLVLFLNKTRSKQIEATALPDHIHMFGTAYKE